VIEIEHLTKRFPGAATPAVDDISLAIGAGEICVLIGPSGCGKTTTMRMINRMIEPDAGPRWPPVAPAAGPKTDDSPVVPGQPVLAFAQAWPAKERCAESVVRLSGEFNASKAGWSGVRQ